MKIVVRLDKEQSKHVSRLADAGDISEAEVIGALVDMDRMGEGGVPKSVIELVTQLANACGLATFGASTAPELAPKPSEKRVGRPSAFTPSQMCHIQEMREKLGWSPQRIADDMNGNGVKCSRGSVMRALARLGL